MVSVIPFSERLKWPEPLVYDGGFGSQLFAHGVELTNSTLANDLHPEKVVDIHTAYIEAGADAIGTNTFVASSLHLEMAGWEGDDADKIARLGAEHARAAVERSGKEVYVAGSIGPSPGAIEADAGDVDFGIPNESVRQAHERVIHALAESGVDFFCIETMFSAKEASIAVDIARKTGIPIAVNLTYKYTKNRKTGEPLYRTDWGDSAGSLLDILTKGELADGDNLLESVDILGLNCGAEANHSEHTGMPYAIRGTQQIFRELEVRGIESKKLMAYPNAGLPKLDRQTKKTFYSQSAEEMAGQMDELLAAGALIVGGCCGTGPDHIRAFRSAVDHASDS
jgi:methionine synthase I (cobalamin-dependent)